jgi:hypothetical protein
MRILFAVVTALLASVAGYLVGSLTGGRTIEAPPAEWTKGSPAGESWRNLLVSLEAAGARVFATTDDPRERLVGLEYLAQLASASLEMKLAKGDPAAPRFTDWMSDYRKFLGDSPDAVYKSAEISPEHDYVVTGNVGEASYLGFLVYGRSVNGWNRAGKNISLDTMQVSDSGDFQLLLSRERPDNHTGNWLPLEQDAHMLMVRQYFHDRPGSREADFEIRTLESPSYGYASDAELAGRIDAATAFFNDTLAGNIALIDMIATTANTFDTPKGYNADFGGIFYPTHDNVYHGGWYDLEPGQALVVEGRAPDVDYWSISLQNRWMQSYDYKRFPVSLNNRAINVDPDGNYRVVIAASDPGIGDWLSTAGFRHGLMAIRYQLATQAEPPVVRLTTVEALNAESR